VKRKELPRKLRAEFWNFLYSQGFPSTINDEALFLVAERVRHEVFKGKRLRLKNWSFISGGEHAEDVALIMLLAKELGLRQRLDWDWGLDYDNYHFSVAFSYGERVKRLLRLLELYYEASLVLLRASLKLRSMCSLEDYDLQRVFADECQRLREEKQSLKSELMQRLAKVIS